MNRAGMIEYTRLVWKTNYLNPGMLKEIYIYPSKSSLEWTEGEVKKSKERTFNPSKESDK